MPNSNSTTQGTLDVPGTKIEDMSGSVGTAGEQSFTLASTTTLSASTKYFVLASGDGTVTIVLPATTDCDAQGAGCTSDGRMLSSRLEFTVPGP